MTAIPKNSIKWNVTKDEAKIIEAIVRRGVAIKLFQSSDRVLREIDLIACHRNGTPLDLAKLLYADSITFIHDLTGINRHICHQTGRLQNQFLPRCAKKDDRE